MLGAFLTTFFFSLSSIFANRSIRAVGAGRANLGRLIFGAFCLGIYAHTCGSGFSGAGRRWFFISGVIGMGLGDLAGQSEDVTSRLLTPTFPRRPGNQCGMETTKELLGIARLKIYPGKLAKLNPALPPAPFLE